MQVELSMEQMEFLLELVDEKKRSLLLEIAHTSRRDYRQTLQHQAFVIDGVLESLNVAKANVLQECP